MNGKSLLTSAAMRIFFGCVTPALYKIKSHSPLNEKKAVFVEYRREALPDSLELIWQELEQRGYSCSVHLLRQGFSGVAAFLRNCISLVGDIADAKYIVVCEGGKAFSRAKLRKETKLLQTWHACGAFKKFGFSAAQAQSGADMKQLKFYMPYRADLCSVSSESVVPVYEEAFGKAYGNNVEILPLGVSRTDVFFNAERKERAEKKLCAIHPEAAAKKRILYAPTFRGEVSEARAPESPDIELLRDSLADDFILLIKQHPVAKGRPEIPHGCEAFAFDISDSFSAEEALLCADVCVSDYSSIVFEGSLLDKPMIFFMPDLAEYELERGLYYPLSELCPGPVANGSKELAELLRQSGELELSPVRRFKERFMSACDGNSTKRIVDRLLSL